MSPEPAPPVDWAALLKKSFGLSFWLFVLVAAALGALCYALNGADAFRAAVEKDRELLGDVLPRVLAAQVAAGFIWVLVPRERMTAMLDKSSGRRGLFIAAAAGVITPGGPASAFPFLALLAAAGADRGVLVAYITAWAVLGVQRMIVWDIAFMGLEFSLFRYLISLPLPIVAGVIARRLWRDDTAEGRAA